MRIVGHRGARGLAPENTFAGFSRGIEEGSDCIEFDVNLTKDNQVVVIHDSTLDRTTNLKGKISDFNWDEIKDADAGSWFGEEYKGEKIPLLSEALDFIIPKAIPVIELKMSFILNSGLVEEVCKICKKYTEKSPLVFISFFHPALRTVKELLPTTQTGILYNSGIEEPWILMNQVNADAIHPRGDAFNEAIAKECHNRGIPLRPWIANTDSQFEYFEKLGVDALGTDYPDILFRYLKQR